MSIGNGVQSVGVGFIPSRRDRYDPSNPVYLAFKPILLFEEPFLEGINPSPVGYWNIRGNLWYVDM
jgi:hypothetical protein